MSEMLVGVRGFEPPAPASRKHCSTCPGRDHLLSSAIDHLADVHIAKRTFRGVPKADFLRAYPTASQLAEFKPSQRHGFEAYPDRHDRAPTTKIQLNHVTEATML